MQGELHTFHFPRRVWLVIALAVVAGLLGSGFSVASWYSARSQKEAEDARRAASVEASTFIIRGLLTRIDDSQNCVIHLLLILPEQRALLTQDQVDALCPHTPITGLPDAAIPTETTTTVIPPTTVVPTTQGTTATTQGTTTTPPTTGVHQDHPCPPSVPELICKLFPTGPVATEQHDHGHHNGQRKH